MFIVQDTNCIHQLFNRHKPTDLTDKKNRSSVGVSSKITLSYDVQLRLKFQCLQGDPVQTLLAKFLGDAEASKRQSLSADQVSQDELGLRKLIVSAIARIQKTVLL